MLNHLQRLLQNGKRMRQIGASLVTMSRLKGTLILSTITLMLIITSLGWYYKVLMQLLQKSKGNPSWPTVPWWNKACSVLWKVTRKCYRKHKTSQSPLNRLIYQHALAQECRYYKKAKHGSWVYYVNGITSKSSMNAVWQKIRKLSRKFVPAPLPSLKVNDTCIMESHEVAETFEKNFSNISCPSHFTPEFQQIRDAQVPLIFSQTVLRFMMTTFPSLNWRARYPPLMHLLLVRRRLYMVCWPIFQ